MKEAYIVSPTISVDEVGEHLTKWFGEDWDGQTGTQVYAMTLTLLDKLGVVITPSK